MTPAALTPQAPSLKPLVTLTTDFGLSDTYVAQMKGVFAGISPDVRVVDATHGIPPQDVVAGALALDAIVDTFPDGTIHVVVVDPGVGSDRAAVAVRTDRFILIGPDNGLFTLVLDRYPPASIVQLTNVDYHRATVSATFHGRDVFAPVAAHLANGVPFQALGEPVNTLVNLNIPQAAETAQGMVAVVLGKDHFGNLVTNLTRTHYDGWLERKNSNSATVSIKGRVIGSVRGTFTDAEPGDPVAYFGSSGRLELAVRDGSASCALGSDIRVTLRADQA